MRNINWINGWRRKWRRNDEDYNQHYWVVVERGRVGNDNNKEDDNDGNWLNDIENYKDKADRFSSCVGHYPT
jgi:hypothetical protein